MTSSGALDFGVDPDTEIFEGIFTMAREGQFPSFPGQLSLAIPPCVGAMSTGDGYGHR